MKKSDLQVIAEMTEYDIQRQKEGATLNEQNALVLMSPHFVEAHSVNEGGVISMGVSHALLDAAAAGRKFVFALYVMDEEEFFKRKNENNEQV